MRLRQSTAVAISFGPFVSQTDGVTLKTGLVSALDHASTGIKLSKNGGALTIRHASVTASTYDSYGNYIVTLDTTDVNTLGTLRVQFADATTNLVVFQDFEVVNANEWDSSFGTSVNKFADVKQWLTGTIPAVNVTGIPKVDATHLLGTAWLTPGTAGTPDVNTKLISGDSVAADNAESFFDGTGYAGTNNVIPTVTAVTGLTASNLDTTVSSRLASASYTAPPSAATVAAAVWAYVCEGTLTALNLIRVISAACAGKASGLATTTAVYRAADDSKDRITATVDADGNRTAVTLDGS